jgi:SAM-dependent methyltransferase
MSNIPIKQMDDYDWPSYTEIYSKQTSDMQSEGSHFLVKDSFVEYGKITWKDELHQNWKELYTQVLNLQVKNVFECGCGPGYHLYNIQKLMQWVQIYGGELLQTQLDFGKNTLGLPSELFDNIDIVDFSVPCASCLFDYKYEFVYTQAVTMHLNHNKAVEFIRNMANISQKYVFLMENWNNHDYPSLLQESGVLNVFSYQMVDGEHQRYLLLTK